MYNLYCMIYDVIIKIWIAINDFNLLKNVTLTFLGPVIIVKLGRPIPCLSGAACYMLVMFV